MPVIRKGQWVTLKPEFLDPGEENEPHVALEDSFDGFVRVIFAGPWPYRFRPVTDWKVEWIAEATTENQ